MPGFDDPLVQSPPSEVPLANAPLIRVIAQLRFPLVIAIEQRDFIAPFQEAIRKAYPILRQEQTQQLVFGPQMAAPAAQQSTAWRFGSENGEWRVSLTPDFLALETTKYKSRTDFLERLSVVTRALAEHIQPKLVDRLGIRYIDRLEADALGRMVDLIRPELRGIVGTPLSKYILHTINETVLEHEEAQMIVRWGQLPPNVTVDPGAIEPLSQPSWILDLDMFNKKPFPFSNERVLAEATRYAERLYAFFRWAVTPEFLRQYGGK
jgi:uncharacterized protein (TIGR04255 family)